MSALAGSENKGTGVVVHTHNPATQKAEAEGLQVQG
jgi:hypothetical protein